MPLLGLALVLILPFAVLALMPLSLFLRYRASTARRMARGWVAALNVIAFVLSATLFLAAAALTNLRVPHAFPDNLHNRDYLRVKAEKGGHLL